MPALKESYSYIQQWEYKNIDADKYLYCTPKIPVRYSEAEYDELANIYNLINDHQYLLHLTETLDGTAKLHIAKETFSSAASFLKDYAKRVFMLYNVVVEPPVISPLKDGSIDLEWLNDKATLLINFKNEKTPLDFYYGKLLDQTYDTNGQITPTLIKDSLADWLKYFPEMEEGKGNT